LKILFKAEYLENYLQSILIKKYHMLLEKAFWLNLTSFFINYLHFWHDSTIFSCLFFSETLFWLFVCNWHIFYSINFIFY